MRRISRVNNKDEKLPALAKNSSGTRNQIQQKQTTSTSRVLKYLDDYRSPADAKSLRDEGYEIDYDRLVGIGNNSAVFLAHLVNAVPPPADAAGQRPLYTPGYDIAAKVVAKKWISNKRPSKTRTGNLKLALALGQTKVENNILKVIDVFKTNERIFIFMQYCPYGNVISFIRRNGTVSFRLAQRWSSQMAAALCFLHKFQVAHRNYKLENVLIDEHLNAKLTGFGLSKFCIDLQTKQPVLSRTICGSEPYLAPEMLKDSKERYYDAKQADVWAFGVGLFLCSTRRYPFEADNLRALKLDQLARRYMEKDTKKRLRTVVRELLNMIFVIEPSQRPTMQDLINKCAWLRMPETPPMPLPATGIQQPTPAATGGATKATPPPPPAAGKVDQTKSANQIQQAVAMAAARRSAPDSPTPGGRSPALRSVSSMASNYSQASGASGGGPAQHPAQAPLAPGSKQVAKTSLGRRPRPRMSPPVMKHQTPSQGSGRNPPTSARKNVDSAQASTIEGVTPGAQLAPEQSQKETIKTILNPVTPVRYDPNQALPHPQDDKFP